jgi:CheY-like chemotaxis protein
MSITANPSIKTLNVGDRDRQKLVSFINALGKQQAASVIADTDRRNLRVDFSVKNILLEVLPDDGEAVKFEVVGRNLSNRGFAFIHGQFVHINVRCRLFLPQINDDRIYCVDGYITRSRHIKGLIHEVVMIFDHPIDLTRFVKLAPSQMKKNMRDRGDDRAGHVIVAMMGRENRTLKFAVTPKVLDDENITFHHGLKFKPGIICVVGLPCKDGTQISVTGKIDDCEPIEENVYVVNVKYDKPVDSSKVITWMDECQDVLPNARKALVIDDDPDANTVLELRLMQMDVKPIISTTSTQAMSILSKENIDVVLLDIYLGEEVGFDVSMKLRQIGYEGPIIAMSSDNSLNTEGHSLASGCNSFLSKPIKPDALHEMLARLWNSDGEIQSNE